MVDSLTTNSDAALSALAREAAGHLGRSAEAWMQCAHNVLRAREIAEHGQWGKFLAEAGIPERTAQRMLMLARSGLKSDIMSEMGGPTPTSAYLAALNQSMEDWQEVGSEIEASGNVEAYSRWKQGKPDGPNTALLWLGRWEHVEAILVVMHRLRLQIDDNARKWLELAWLDDSTTEGVSDD